MVMEMDDMMLQGFFSKIVVLVELLVQSSGACRVCPRNGCGSPKHGSCKISTAKPRLFQLQCVLTIASLEKFIPSEVGTSEGGRTCRVSVPTAGVEVANRAHVCHNDRSGFVQWDTVPFWFAQFFADSQGSVAGDCATTAEDFERRQESWAAIRSSEDLGGIAGTNSAFVGGRASSRMPRRPKVRERHPQVGGQGAIARDGRCCRCNESTASTGDGLKHVETLGLSPCAVATEESCSGGRIAEELANLCFSKQQDGLHRAEERFGFGASPAGVHGSAECCKPCRA